jgi:hypothetical protein
MRDRPLAVREAVQDRPGLDGANDGGTEAIDRLHRTHRRITRRSAFRYNYRGRMLLIGGLVDTARPARRPIWAK